MNESASDPAPSPAEPIAPSSSLPAVACNSLTRVYPSTRREPARTALDAVSLTVQRGEWLALLGPNGSGKSTLLRLIATMDRPDSGGLSVLNADPAGPRAALRELRARLGVVFQRPGLDALLTIRENLLLQAALLGIVRSEVENRVRNVAGALGIIDRLGSRVSTLSGGLARRADLARALLCEPELLLLDEPTAGLDLDARAALPDLLDQRRRSALKPFTIIMTTHLMDEAERATRVALMHEGRLVAEGRPAELRRALGGNVVVTRSDSASVLESSGLTLTRSTPEAVGAGSPEAVEKAAVALARASVPFTVGPPTLADVYFAHTGARLAEGGAA